MARIRNYVTDNNITDQDIVVGSDGDNSGVTKNFNVATLKQYVSNGLVEEAPIDGVMYSRKDAEWVASSLSSDEIIEVDNYSELPFPGVTGVLYLTLDTSKLFVWNGSYSEINQSSISPFSNITEGGNIGIVRTARNPLNYGDIGSGAIDFSISTEASSTYGATGLNSFASGRSNKSPGSFSHSQNIQNKANGYASSASGIYNVASGRGEMATGMYGTEYTATDTVTDKVFNVGAGTSTLNKKDAFSLFRNLAAKFTPTALSSITNQVAGFFIFDSSDSNRPAIHDGTAWKKLSYQDDVPNLDEVTTEGNTTDNSITINDASSKPSYTDDWVSSLTYSGNGTNAKGVLKLREFSVGDGFVSSLSTEVLADNRSLSLPDKNGILAVLTDIPSVDSTPTNGSSNAVSSDGVFDALALKADLVAGKVPSSQLPSYVDDVIEGYYSTGVFYSDSGLTTPITGEVGKIYVDLLLNQSYRWSGSVYVQISNAISGLNDLTDVTVSTPLNGQLIQYNSTTSQWENQSITIGTGDMQKSVYDTDDDGIVDSAKKEVVQFINKSGSTITKGTIVYLKSTSSSSTYPEVLKANAATEATSSKTIGAVFEDVANDATGFIVTSGEVRNLDTSAYVIGDKLWLSTTDGLVTTTPPTQPNHTVFIGTVTRAQSANGRILYAIQNGYELGELHNVLLTSPTDNQVLTYESSTSLWKNKTISGGTQLTRQEFTYAGGAQTFTLSSTPSYIYAVFVNGQELNSSQYSFVTTTLTIADTLVSGYKVNIVYSETAGGVLDYYTKAQIDAFNYEPNHAEFVEVNALSDLPSPSGGIITLVAGYTYLFLKHIDLLGSRLVCGQDTVIVGWSSENCSITSTGLSAASALVTSNYSLPIRNISFTHDKVFDLDGDGTTTALDWFGVNLLNCASGGTIKNYTNFVAGDSALLNSGGFSYDGTIGTVAFSNCLFDVAPTKTAITILPTCTISRRVRVIYSSFVVLSGETGVNFSTSATVGDEKYILDTCNFSGGGTYVSGILYPSNKALFSNCVGITNTSTRGFMYMVNNTTDTTIGLPNVNVWVKAAGTTTANANNSKFTHASNQLTYTGAFATSFQVSVNCNVRSGSPSQVISVGVAKNGTILAESEMTIRTDIANQEYPGSTAAQVDLVTNDYVEIFVKTTSSSNLRIADLNVSISKIPV